MGRRPEVFGGRFPQGLGKLAELPEDHDLSEYLNAASIGDHPGEESFSQLRAFLKQDSRKAGLCTFA